MKFNGHGKVLMEFGNVGIYNFILGVLYQHGAREAKRESGALTFLNRSCVVIRQISGGEPEFT